jgi:hypothetical protein
MADDSTWLTATTIAITPPARWSTATIAITPPPAFVPGESGTGRLSILYVTDKRHRGKPPLANRLKRDRIVAYVQHLQRTKPGRKLSRYVEAAADFFKCDERTVWNAWTEYRPRPYKTAFPDVEWGEPHLVTTVRIGPIDLGPSRSTAG